MFQKPANGWVSVIINNKPLGTASYLDDVPMMTLDAFMSYFYNRINHTSDNNFAITFDAEGYNFGILLLCDTLYYFHTDTADGLPAMEILEDGLPCEFMPKLAQYVIHDLTRDNLAWSKWNPEIETNQDANAYKTEMTQKIAQLNDLLKQYKKGF